MNSDGHRRQVILFLVAVVVPSLVLVALGLRMASQERELNRSRLEEEHRRLVRDIREDLLASLERIRLHEISELTNSKGNPARTAKADYESSAVVLVSWVENNRLALPWESDRTADESQRLLDEGPFARRIQQGEQQEFVGRQFGRAVETYRQASRDARHPLQIAYAHLLLGRALAKSGRRTEANAHYRGMLGLPSDLVDDQRVPLSLYAGERLLEAGVEREAVLSRIQAELASQRWLTPVEAYQLRQLSETLIGQTSDDALREAASELKKRIEDGILYLEQVLALQNDFASLMVIPPASKQEPLWVPYGDPTWLVSAASAGGQPAVIVVSADRLLASLAAAGARSDNVPVPIQLHVGRAAGDSLGESFPGLKVAFAGKTQSEPVNRRRLQGFFYIAASLLVLSVTSFGAYLVWRDVRRGLKLAELRSQFVSNVSHELKTPLTAIRIFAETIRMRRYADEGTQAEYLETIVNESERLTRLLNNVLDFSKIEEGKKTYHLGPTSLAEVVQTCARTLEYPLAQQGFCLRLAVENNLRVVNADRDALQQAILNLLSNAMKYSGDSREIDLRLGARNGEAVIEVSDHGIGIPAEEHPRIFERFHRVPTPENKLIPGTGLGLTLVAHVAKAHGGRVEVRSAIARGSTFSIHLPLETEQ